MQEVDERFEEGVSTTDSVRRSTHDAVEASLHNTVYVLRAT